MSENLLLKEKIVKHIVKIIEDKINETSILIKSAIESRDNETKSSVGDKYETGRSMIQFEMEKHHVQLQKLQTQKYELTQINRHNTNSYIEFGSLVFTTDDNYFMSIGIGRIEVDNENFICISPISPIGKILKNRMKGDKFDFQGKEILITDCY